MKNQKFLRRESSRYSKLGKKRKKKQTWRKPKGRDNKMREKRRGYPAIVSIGYGKNKKEKGKINGKSIKIIKNLEDIKKISKNEIAILGKIGKKKIIEIVNYAKKEKIEILNLNIKKFVKKIEFQKKQKSEKKKIENKKVESKKTKSKDETKKPDIEKK